MTFVILLFNALILAHVATAFVGLAAFWMPLFARKSGRVHVRAGRILAYCAYVMTLSAVTASAGRVVSFQVQGIGFGAQRLWAYELAGPLAIVPWILPTVVGIPAIVAWTRDYQRKFGPAAPSAA